MNDDLIEIEFESEWFNPRFSHLIDLRYRYVIHKGTRNSGKSTFVARWLVYLCLTLDRFYCIHSRKTKEAVGTSTFLKLKEAIQDSGLEEFFKFNNTKKDILCTLNGNEFVGKGMDDPEKTKSTIDPTHIWLEEADQFDINDFLTLDTLLRGAEDANLCLILSLNPMSKNGWIYTTFFQGVEEKENGKFKQQYEGKEDNSLVVHSTYHENEYTDQKGYAKILEKYKEIDENLYSVYNDGEWGVENPEALFMKHFNDDHIYYGDMMDLYDPREFIYLSWDFNITISCMVRQYSEDYIYDLKEYHISGFDIEDVCLQIREDFPNQIYFITGDASGGNRSALNPKIERPAYRQIMHGLGYHDWENFNVPKSNPAIASSRFLSNAILKKEKKRLIHHECKELIQDCRHVEYVNYDQYKKKNPDRGHMLDCLRYADWAFCYERLESYGLQLNF